MGHFGMPTHHHEGELRMSDYTPHPDDLDEEELDGEEVEDESIPVEDVEPLAESEMTESQPEQLDAQDDPSLGDAPEVEEDDG